jgi:hypothetical protein
MELNYECICTIVVANGRYGGLQDEVMERRP